MTESEYKFLLKGGRELPGPNKLVKGLGTYSVSRRHQEAEYYDTADLRLTRAGASLRFRSDDGWTVKLPERQHRLLERDEIVFGFPDTAGPPREAVALVRALCRTAPLDKVATVTTDRQEIRIVDRHGQPVGSIDDDRVRAKALRNGSTSFHEVELEVASDADAELVDELVARLRKAGARADGPRPKVARALGEPARARPDVVPGDRLGRRSTPSKLVQTVLANGLHRLVTHDPIVRTDEDPEGVHQARVGTRRLRSDLRTLRPLLARVWTEPLRDELKWLGGLLGDVRDADVLRELLAPRLSELPASIRQDASALVRHLDHERGEQIATLQRALESHRYLALLDNLVATVREPPLDRVHLDPDVRNRRAVERLTRKPWKRLRRAVDALTDEPSDPELHEVRKRAKQARYAYEATAPIIGKAARRLAKELAGLQDVLGAHQDAVVATDWLYQTAVEIGDARTGYAAGRLAQIFDDERRALRTEWRRQCKRVRKAHRRL
jgi:CHAD domain-containing protein